ncbi:MAG: FmdB family regulatory protein [uncultured bacterium]|nr:MAG: FmdB family regulatory protein [uncultured bacterium]OGT34165.1 MAG: hypothetical protein A3C44_01250 [Gammaproteobacteria bacterium RIFCSPHIGHO2_02_FULL_39_13]OGT50063.1 MAG: hypothetical protein A3E53_02545 [Gammaproteobacteria bacterium RIFCSPHIGHO2_12_FULL_39_24]
MPLYEYYCSQCSKSTELLQKYSDAPAKTCPHCHKDTLEKQISATRFQLKGTGWYATDFRDTKKKPATTENKTESSATDTKPPEKADK